MECPFCGIVTEVPHQSQQACIDALHAEIDRVKLVVDCLQSAVVPLPAESSEDTSDSRREARENDEESLV
jgi:hypothetical protein